MPKTELTAAARAIRDATTDAVTAAQEQNSTEYEEATSRLATCDPEQVRVVLGIVVRALLEDLHPDGVASDDLLVLIRGCVRSAFSWYPAVDVEVLIVVLTGSLGVHEPDEEPLRVTPQEVARHAPLFLTELLAATGSPAPTMPAKALPDYLTGAFEEVSRSELNTMP